MIAFLVIVAVLAASAGALVASSARQRREELCNYKASLADETTQAIESRAWNWSYLERHADSSAVKEFRALLEARRYAEMLARWRKLTISLSAVGDDSSPAKPEFYDSGSDIALRAYVELLNERAARS